MCFAEDYKLRTVLWQWRGKTLLKHRVHPFPPADWPAVPWPPV